MKPRSFIVALMSAWLVLQPVHQSRAVAGPVCIFILITVTAAGAVVVVRCCQPSYRCTSDPESPGTNWCSTMTRMAAKGSGLVQAGPNFRSYTACMRICATNTTATADGPESEPQLVVEKSTDLLTWTNCGVMEMTWNGEIEWRDPAPMERQCFYRVRQVEAPALAAKK